MAEEIELKLALRPQDQSRFLRQPLLKTATRHRAVILDNIYYDTPDLALRRHGIALRLRRQGLLWLQTVKQSGTTAAGLSSRPEWETPYAGHFDFSAIEADKLRRWLARPHLISRLLPIFETRFRRTTWYFKLPTGNVLLTLDRGWIIAGGKREAISELELELVEPGEEALESLFSLASTLAARTPLVPAVRSKAERGYLLHGGVSPQPVKASDIPLAGSQPPLSAFRRIALACLDHLQQNYDGALSSEDPEYIHQMRVALRRLFAALRLFAPLLPELQVVPLKDALRSLARKLGETRDLDVLQTEIIAPVLAALPDEPRLAMLSSVITLQRCQARNAAVDLLRSAQYGKSLIFVLHTLFCRLPVAETDASVTLAGFAAARLKRLHKTLLRRACAAKMHDPLTLHALRIAVKRLRYALEFFAPLLPRAKTRATLNHLTDLQDTLGQINDLAQAGTLLMHCASDDPRLREAVTLIGGWHGPRHARLLASVPKHLAHLARRRFAVQPA